MAQGDNATKRCAVYTRKSSEEGLEQKFDSLHAQRRACEAFVKSQAGEGWRLVKTAYDDGGFSGGTMDRPALKALLEHVKEKRSEQIQRLLEHENARLGRARNSEGHRVARCAAGQRVALLSAINAGNTSTKRSHQAKISAAGRYTFAGQVIPGRH